MVDGVHPTDAAHLAAILDETRVMGRLIDDLRTMALSEAGTLTLHREPTDPDVLVDEVVRSFEAAAGTAGVTVTAEVPDDLPILDVDPVRLREVLANLVANAIRHTPPSGTVVIRGAVADDRLELRVADSGPGIDPWSSPRLRSFRQGRGLGRLGPGPRDGALPRGRARGHTRGRGLGEYRHHVQGDPAPALRPRDPDVVHGRLDGRGHAPVLGFEHDPHRLPGPRRHRHRDRGPRRQIVFAPSSWRTIVRVPSSASTNARNESALVEFEECAK